MRPPAAVASLILWTMLGASGCGQKGSLYLPEPAPQAVPPPPAAGAPEDKSQTRKTPRIPDPVTAQ
jgi:predicted small lipoprotein YifL